MELELATDDPEVDCHFVASYPPFSVWSPTHVPAALHALAAPSDDGTDGPLGLYLHIPFCRKRCKFCYFRVYTDKNSSDIETYLDALVQEVSLYARSPRVAGRSLEFVYFGGGTPSYLSSDQLRRLMDRIGDQWPRTTDCEGTFECEPGTLNKAKLEAIKEIGTTRLSIGVEHFDDEVLDANGRPHKSAEIHRSYEWAQEVGFDQINLDLIVGMVGDTEGKWKETVAQTLAMDADSVTIYQMELPYNSTFAREAKASGESVVAAGLATKRAWLAYAFGEFESAGYVVVSAYTVVKPSGNNRFVYRDSVWRGRDMIGTGVASFSYLGGVHFQNFDKWDAYIEPLGRKTLPLARAYVMSDRDRLIREFALQLKLGRVDTTAFRDKFGVDIGQEFAKALSVLSGEGMLDLDGDAITLTRAGLLRADAIITRFFDPQFRDIRYS